MFKYFLILFLAVTSFIFASSWDQEYWQFMRHEQWNASPYRLYYSGDIRWNKGMSQVYHYRMSENFAYQAKPHIDLEAHYSYVYNKARDAYRFNNASRFELEINPHFSLNEATFRFRNRMEFIKRHRELDWRYVFRQRTFLRFPVKNISYIKSVGMNNEFFFDLNRDQITQNRFVPLEISLAFSCINLDVFIMIRDFYSFNSNQWFKSFVIGTEVSF